MSATPIEAFLRISDGARAWLASGSPDDELPPHPTGFDVLLKYLRIREHAAGDVMMNDLLSRMFETMIRRLKPKCIVYPFENRSWEKRLLRVARLLGVSRCIGYQHSSITPRHLAYEEPTALSRDEALPDMVITCGEVTAELLRSTMPRMRDRIVVGAALRMHRLELPAPVGWTLLASISSSRSEAWEILNALQEFVGHSDLPVLVRPHPTIPVDDLFEHFSWPAQVCLSKGRSLRQDLSDCAIILYSSSTVAVEGLLYGRLAIFLDIGDLPSGDPIRGDHPFVVRVKNGRELASAIARMQSYDSASIARLQECARVYAERYFVAPTPERVAEMAGLIARC